MCNSWLHQNPSGYFLNGSVLAVDFIDHIILQPGPSQHFLVHYIPICLTDRDPAMGAYKVDIGLGDGTHPDLVISSAEEASKGADKCHSTISAGCSDGHSNQVLFRNEAFNVPVWKRFLQHRNLASLKDIMYNNDEFTWEHGVHLARKKYKEVL